MPVAAVGALGALPPAKAPADLAGVRVSRQLCPRALRSAGSWGLAWPLPSFRDGSQPNVGLPAIPREGRVSRYGLPEHAVVMLPGQIRGLPCHPGYDSKVGGQGGCQGWSGSHADRHICGKTHGPVCNTQYWETLALPLWVFDVVCFCVKGVFQRLREKVTQINKCSLCNPLTERTRDRWQAWAGEPVDWLPSDARGGCGGWWIPRGWGRAWRLGRLRQGHRGRQSRRAGGHTWGRCQSGLCGRQPGWNLGCGAWQGARGSCVGYTWEQGECENGPPPPPPPPTTPG